MLELLGENVPFELALGLNGRVWVRGGSIVKIKCCLVYIKLMKYMVYSCVGKLVVRTQACCSQFVGTSSSLVEYV